MEHILDPELFCFHAELILNNSNRIQNNRHVLYTGERVCDVALIKHTLGSGKTQGGLGIWRGGYKGAMGDKES
jgi:hypothetical protein